MLLILIVHINLIVAAYVRVRSPQGQLAPVLDLMYGFTPTTAYNLLTQYGEGGRQKYLFSTVVVDTIYAVVYTLFLVLAMHVCRKKTDKPDERLLLLTLLPWLTFLADLAENVGICTMILAYPLSATGAARFASVASQVKWLSTGVSVTILVAWLLYITYQQIQKKAAREA